MTKIFSPQVFAMNDPFPPSMTRNFKYAEQITHLTTGSTSGVFGNEYRFRLNSLYDPDYAGGGHQPYGYDQFNGVYQKYRVDKCSWRISFTTPGASNDVLCALTVSPGTSATMSGVTIYKPLEWPNSSHGYLSSTGTRLCVLQGSADLQDIVSVPKAKYVAEENFGAEVTTNPVQVCLLSISCCSPSNNTSQAVSIIVELDYQATLYQRVMQASS